MPVLHPVPVKFQYQTWQMQEQPPEHVLGLQQPMGDGVPFPNSTRRGMELVAVG